MVGLPDGFKSPQNKEFVLWGIKVGYEDEGENTIRVDGEEFQTNLKKAQELKKMLEKRGDFKNIRIQTINYNQKFNFLKECGVLK